MAAFTDELDPPEAVEITRLTIEECFVYKIPPLGTSSGHRADDWGLANPLLTGALKCVQQDDVLYLRLFEKHKDPEDSAGTLQPTTLRLFAECPIKLETGKAIAMFVEPVVDSSRYFVVRCVERSSQRRAYIGIGFRERQDAFDLKASLGDFERYVSRQTQARRQQERQQTPPDADPNHQAAEDGPAPLAEPAPFMGLQEGQKIHISIKGGGAKKKKAGPKPAAGANGATPLLPAFGAMAVSAGGATPALAPAPAPAPAPVPAPAPATTTEQEEEWGDFEEA